MTTTATMTKADRFKKYWTDVWLGVTTTWVGMTVTFKTFFRPKVTLLYPEVRPDIPAGSRGIHGYDEDKCISCDLCAVACPVDCIYIKSVGRGNDAMMTQFDIDYTKCLFCDLCTPPCPTECIWMTQEYDLSSYTKNDCIINFATTKTAEQVAGHETLLAKKDEEKKKKAAAKKAAAAAAKEGAQGAAAPEKDAPEK